MQGDVETGVTIMLIDAGVDTGPILLQQSIPISRHDTTGSLTERLANVGAEALLEALPLWISGELIPQPQDERQASYTRMLRKEDGEIDWHRPADLLARQVRAYTPWPTAYTNWRSKLVKIVSAHALVSEAQKDAPVGTAMLHKEDSEPSLQVVTGEGMLVIDRLQLEGKKAMSAGEFLRGYPQIVGDMLG